MENTKMCAALLIRSSIQFKLIYSWPMAHMLMLDEFKWKSLIKLEFSFFHQKDAKWVRKPDYYYHSNAFSNVTVFGVSILSISMENVVELIERKHSFDSKYVSSLKSFNFFQTFIRKFERSCGCLHFPQNAILCDCKCQICIFPWFSFAWCKLHHSQQTNNQRHG